jgi:hypothetical protein
MKLIEGDSVQVQCFGNWYPGVVTRIGRTLVEVRYTTGAGRTRLKRVRPGHLVPAGTYPVARRDWKRA